MKKKAEPFSINVKDNWGGLVKPEEHDAAVGMRLCDNTRRELQGFADRKTVVGDYSTAIELQKFLASKKTIADIRRNTSFSFGGDDRNCWARTYVIGRDTDINVTLDVMCSGEYCYVRAYADRIPKATLEICPEYEGTVALWRGYVKDHLSGNMLGGPLVCADNRRDAMKKLVEFVANELEAKDCLE